MSKKILFMFDLKDVDKLGCQWNWVVSERSTGKTYQVLLKGFEDYIKSGEVDQLAIVRRWESDWSGATGMKTCFNSLMSNGNGENMISKISKGKYDGVEYHAGLFYLTKYNKETGETESFKDKVIAYGFSLNLAERIKGGSFPNIHRILIDEACTTSVYLKNEFSAMQSIVSTIIRMRTDCRVYLMANNVDFYCPTFDDFGISESLVDMKQGETKIFTYENGMKVSFTWLDALAHSGEPKPSDIFFGFGDASSKMITEGAWEMPEVPHLPDTIKYHPNEIIFEYFIEYKGKLAHCEIVQMNDCMFTFIHKKTTPIKDPEDDMVFTDEIGKAIRPNFYFGWQAVDNMSKKVLGVFKDCPVFYDSNTTGSMINSFIQNIGT